MSKINLKTPLSYYGGKQKLAIKIISLIPDHTLYCEPFIGGGAIFFGKPPSKVEVINDTNSHLITFYSVLKNDYESLEKLIKSTLHSRGLHAQASVIYNYPDMFTQVQQAWAVWVGCTQSFSSQLEGGFGYDIKTNTTTKKIINNRERFSVDFKQRLDNCQIECADALYVIASRDSENSFFYCDPPYINSSCSHYKSYTEQDYESLLKTLSKIKGKFLLSSYPSSLLTKYIKLNKWYSQTIESGVTVNNITKHSKRKTEVLTGNYPI